MSDSLFNHTLSIISFIKNNKIYAGTFAWSCNVGYEEFITLMGSQSNTGNILEIGDIVGLNVCSKEQINLAVKIGDTHSNDINKLENVSYNIDRNAILIDNSKINCIAKVKNIIHLEGIEEDNLVYFEILNINDNKNLDFLLMSDINN